jgi:hypothetical protein
VTWLGAVRGGPPYNKSACVWVGKVYQYYMYSYVQSTITDAVVIRNSGGPYYVYAVLDRRLRTYVRTRVYTRYHGAHVRQTGRQAPSRPAGRSPPRARPDPSRRRRVVNARSSCHRRAEERTDGRWRRAWSREEARHPPATAAHRPLRRPTQVLSLSHPSSQSTCFFFETKSRGKKKKKTGSLHT